MEYVGCGVPGGFGHHMILNDTVELRMRRNLAGSVLLTGLAIVFTGCFPGGGASTPEDPAGFLTGIWHGWIAPISLILGIFNQDIRIYETHNTGWWYDLGFYTAVIAGFGSLALVRRKKHTKLKPPSTP